jgi:uncharacterized protein (TIGR03067 family)
MRQLLALLLGTTLLLAAPVPKEKPKLKDDEAILGKWEYDKYDSGNAQAMKNESLEGATIEFKKDGKITLSPPARVKEPVADGEVKLNDAAKVKEFDAEIQGQKIPGLYDLDGDTLKMCISLKMERPTEIKADSQAKIIVVTLKRVKAEEKKDK